MSQRVLFEDRFSGTGPFNDEKLSDAQPLQHLLNQQDDDLDNEYGDKELYNEALPRDLPDLLHVQIGLE